MIKISDIEYFSNDGTIRFLNMDCNDFMKGLKENEFDLNLSDPPYGIGEDGSKNKSRSNKINFGTKNTRNTVVKSKDYKAYSGNDLKAPDSIHFDLVKIKCKNMIIWGANHFIDNFQFNVSSPCWIVWDKDNGQNDFADCELAYTSFKTAVRIFKYRWQGMLQQNMKNKQERIHPTEKPIDLYRWILQNYTKPADTILDCFGGSMSNAIACHMERRKLTIIELDKDYFSSALKRFDFYERQLTLF